MAELPNKRIWWALAVLAIIAGTGGRAVHLDDRPLHADEAVQAWQTWNLLRGEGYQYDPRDRHGPFLYYGSALLHRLGGGHADNYDDRSARRFSWAAGIATLVLIGFGTRPAGLSVAAGALAVGLLAFETLSTLYHTYFVQEAWLTFLIWSFLFVLLGEEPRSRPWWRAVVLGGLAGLALATKEITPIYLLLLGVCWWFTHPGSEPRIRPQGLVIAVLAAALPIVLLYSSFGSNPVGVIELWRHYFIQLDRLGDSPHNHPWWHYLRTLGIWSPGSLRWGQVLLLALGLVGLALAWRPQSTRAHRLIAAFTATLFIFHSLVAYKTPWLLLTPMIGVALLAGQALASLSMRFRWAPALSLVLLVAVASQSWNKSRLALDRYPGDARNPYFYEQAPRNILRLPERLAVLDEAYGRELNVAVVSPEHAWPLPWYFRHRTQVGYFPADSLSWPDWDVVIWDSQLGQIPPGSHPGRIAEFHGLRPNVILEVFIRTEVWESRFPPLPESP